jgi:cobalt-precorrin-5B (C1)-methyltransferase
MTQLRSGLTTGTCAAAAAQAAARVLCGMPAPDRAEVLLPRGQHVDVHILYAKQTSNGSMAAVRKDAGDDPDVTDGMEVVVTLSWSETSRTRFIAGEGVGTVTKPGLQVPPGEPAINPVPRAMIAQAIREAIDRPVRVEVSIPGGREVAVRTFNPRLGIVGGLSVLGTTGIVRPYCMRAMKETIRSAFDVAAACGIAAPILVPGNIGATAAARQFVVTEQQVIEVGNQWGFALDQVADRRFNALMLAGHPGKLAKLIRGDWDTHSSRSRQAVGLVADVAREVLSSPVVPSETVEGLFSFLDSPQRKQLGDEIARRIRLAAAARIDCQVPICVLLIDMAGDRLGTSGDLTPWQ